MTYTVFIGRNVPSLHAPLRICRKHRSQHLWRAREEGVDLCRILAARFGKVGTAAASTADNRCELFHEASCLHARGEILRDGDNEADPAVVFRGEHDDAAADAI